jgi:hypothetical protein
MPLERHLHRDTKELMLQHRAGMKRPIRFWKERVTTEVHWETVWEIATYRNKMCGINWIGFIYLR